MLKLGKNNILTKRENEVLIELVSGYTNRQIAEHLSVSISTIKSIVEKIYLELEVHNRAELILYSIKNGIVLIE